MIRIHLSSLLGQRKMFQSDLSKATGIRPSTISQMYRENIQRINVDHLNSICAVLDCTLSDLIEYIPDQPPNKS